MRPSTTMTFWWSVLTQINIKQLISDPYINLNNDFYKVLDNKKIKK